MVEKQKFPPGDALNVATQMHTSPSMFGKVMSDINPGMAVAYHFYSDFNTRSLILQEIKRTYDGPVSLAVDYMVWNVTKEDIKVRMSAINEDIWPLPSLSEKLPANAPIKSSGAL